MAYLPVDTPNWEQIYIDWLLPWTRLAKEPDQKPPTNLPLNAPPIRLTHEEIENIVTFALTLKDPRLVQ